MDECSAGAQSCRLNELWLHDLLKQSSACSLWSFLSQLDFGFKQISNETLSLSCIIPCHSLCCIIFKWTHSVWQQKNKSFRTGRKTRAPPGVCTPCRCIKKRKCFGGVTESSLLSMQMRELHLCVMMLSTNKQICTITMDNRFFTLVSAKYLSL